MGAGVTSGASAAEEPTAVWSAADVAEALGRGADGRRGWDVVEPVREPLLAVVAEPEPTATVAPPTPAEPLPVTAPPAERGRDAPRAERERDRSPVRSALALLFVAAIAGAGLAAAVAIGFGVIWFALRRIVGG
jgi:hypothetical protein